MTDRALGLGGYLAGNPSSPLFARFADDLLREGEFTRAGELCERGVREYPFYTTGRLVYARCLAARGDYRQAVETLSGIIPQYPGNILLGNLAEEWTSRILPEESFPDTITAPGGPQTEEVSAVQTEEISAVQTEDVAAPQTQEVTPPPKATPVPDDAIALLGGESHPSPLLKSPTGFVERDRIISRTLAEIYASQGAIQEAIETYRLLIERIPAKREEFGGRLRELEERLRSHPETAKIRQE